MMAINRATLQDSGCDSVSPDSSKSNSGILRVGADEAIGVDGDTGLPKLKIEFIPDIHNSRRSRSTAASDHRDEGRRSKSVTFDPSVYCEQEKLTSHKSSPKKSVKHASSLSSSNETVTMNGSSPGAVTPSPSSSSPSTSSHVHHGGGGGGGGGLATSSSVSSLGLSQSLDRPTARKNKGRQNQLLKNRSRSVFIRLQLPQRTPPPAHRPLSVVEEGTQSTLSAPVGGEGGQHYLLQSGSSSAEDLKPRRSSDSGALAESPVFPRAFDGRDDDGVPRSSSLGRRPSFFNMSDVDEEESGNLSGDSSSPSHRLSRTSSISSHVGDETYSTPFAQILANLHRVRAQFLTLVGLPDETRTVHSRQTHAAALTPSTPSTPSSQHRRLTEEATQQLKLETLKEFDWCLKKLETVDSAKSMGTMAQDKFRRILQRELSHMSESNKAGRHVAEWVNNVTESAGADNAERGDRVDKALLGAMHLQLESPLTLEHRLSQSMAHDEWKKIRTRRKESTGKDFCEKVPTYGVDDPKIDSEKMKLFVANDINAWGANTFHLHDISAGNSLVSATYVIFKQRKFFSEFKISPPIFICFMSKIQNEYIATNPYHNSMHAADVFLVTNYLLKAKALEGIFSPMEVLAALVAAAIHDVGHPGKTNQFLINVGHELALLYNDYSVLENHHLALAFKTMQNAECNFLENMDFSQRQAFRTMVIDMVLATDMARHFKHLAELKTLLETKKVANDGILMVDKYNDRSEVLQCLIHCADLSNPAKPEELASDWSDRILREHFLQGDEEKRLGLPVSPLGDRENVCMSKCQVTFIDFIVEPLWETWAELVYPDAQIILDRLQRTRSYWNSQVPPSPPPGTDSSGESTVIVTVPTPKEEEEEGRRSAFLEEGEEEEVCVGSGNVSKESSNSSSSGGSRKDSENSRSSLSDSLTKKDFKNSPAQDRRISYKAIKDTVLGTPVLENEEQSNS